MGKLISKPKMPALPTYTPPPEPVAEPVVDPEKTADEQRAENIMNRHRGRIGTVATSFRGVLSDSAFAPTRKTLLGE